MQYPKRNLRIYKKIGKVGVRFRSSRHCAVMCITGCLLELWVTLFAGRGKATLSLFHVL